MSKLISEYDQEIPQSQTADKYVAPQGRATHQSRDTRKTNKASSSRLPIKMFSKTSIGHKVTHNKTYNNYRIPQEEQQSTTNQQLNSSYIVEGIRISYGIV